MTSERDERFGLTTVRHRAVIVCIVLRTFILSARAREREETRTCVQESKLKHWARQAGNLTLGIIEQHREMTSKGI